MDRRCILGCFTNDKAFQQLLKELREMGIDDNDISMVTAFDKLEHLFGMVLGPLRGADLDTLSKKINHLGFGIEIARSIKSYLRDGGAVAVIACDDYQIEPLRELFNEFGATIVETSE